MIDDEEDAFIVTSLLLHDIDAAIDVRWAVDARRGLDMLVTETFDVCLVDLALGADDGLAVIRHAIEAGSDLPMIALTGNMASTHAPASIAAGATDFLEKGELSTRDLERSIRLGIARMQATARLRESEELYRSVVAAIAEGIVVQGADGTVTASNASAQRILGLAHDELTGRTSRSPEWRTIHEDGSPFEASTHPAMVTLRTGEPQRNVVMGIELPDGATRWITVNTEPVRRTGVASPTAVVASFTDVTEQRELEEQLRQAARLEAVGRLAGGVAHDFNNLLTAITGYGELLVIDESLDEDAREHVEEIRRAAGRAASLTRQLLAFSRRQMLSPELIAVDEVVVGLSSLLRRLIPESIEIHIRPGAAEHLVRVDRAQFEQVIINLATNGRDAMPEGGVLSIETNVVTLDPAHRPDETAVAGGLYVQVTVTDDGVGMDEDTRRQVFEPFFTTKGSGRGTGLGLASVYGTVKQSGGYVWVYSEPRMGTAVKVYLPIAEGEASVDLRPAQPQGGWVARIGEVVLVAEDEAPVRALVVRILERAGYEVLVAPDGTSAIGLAEALGSPISCLVIDVVMPGLHGPAVATRLRARWPALPVVLMSGYTEDPTVVAASAPAHSAFIQKPFSTDTMLRLIRQAIDGES